MVSISNSSPLCHCCLINKIYFTFPGKEISLCFNFSLDTNYFKIIYHYLFFLVIFHFTFFLHRFAPQIQQLLVVRIDLVFVKL